MVEPLIFNQYCGWHQCCVDTLEMVPNDRKGILHLYQTCFRRRVVQDLNKLLILVV